MSHEIRLIVLWGASCLASLGIGLAIGNIRADVLDQQVAKLFFGIAWLPWWVVFAPLWLPAVVILVFAGLCWLYWAVTGK